MLRQHLQQLAVTYQCLYANLYPKLYSHNNRFGIHNNNLEFEYTYRDWYFQKNYKQSVRKDQTDGSCNRKNSDAEVAAGGPNLDTYEQRSAADFNEFEQRPEEIKFESSAVAAKPKKLT